MDATYRQIPIYAMLKAMQDIDALCMVVAVDSHSFNLDSARAHGIDLEKLLVAQPDNSYQAIDIIEAALDSTIRLIVVVGCETMSGDKIEHISVLSRIHDTTVVFTVI